ncbi:MAG: hypothetical protein ACKO7W_11475 [Elainella sp.]
MMRTLTANSISIRPVGMLASNGPAVSLEPCPGWAGRVRLVITQEDCRWLLCPPLWPSEAKRLMDGAAALGIGFDLDLNEGCPIESAAIHRLAEAVLEAAK